MRRFVLMSALGTSEANRELVPYFHAKWDDGADGRRFHGRAVVFRPSFVFGSGRRRAADVRPPGPLVARDDDRRLRRTASAADLGRRRRGVLRQRAIDKADAAGRTFELGGADALTWNDLYARIRAKLGARRATVHVPVSVMRAGAALTDRLPGAPITRDQLTMLVEGGDQTCDIAPAVATFGIEPIGVDEQIRRAT